MKTIVIALSMLFASHGFAEEIKLQKLKELYTANAEAYSKVEVGMTAEYIQINALSLRSSVCLTSRKDIITEVSGEKYLVRSFREALNDCDHQKKGSKFEWSEWKSHSTQEDVGIGEITSITLLGNIVMYHAQPPEWSASPNSYTTDYRLDLTQSQFYNVDTYTLNTGSQFLQRRLINRSVTDVTTLEPMPSED